MRLCNISTGGKLYRRTQQKHLKLFKVILVSIFLYLQGSDARVSCQSYFAKTKSNNVILTPNEDVEVIQFWKKVLTRTKRVQINTESAAIFSDTIKNIVDFSTNKISIDLSKSLRTHTEQYSSEHTYALLLYLVSLTPSGRDLIYSTIPYLNGSKHEFDLLHFRFKLGRGKTHAETDYFATDFEVPPSIIMSRSLKIGIATLAFAHELIHVQNYAERKLTHKLKSTELASALDEVIAYKYEKKIFNDLLNIPAFLDYKIRFMADSNQSLYVFSDPELKQKLQNEYGFSPALVQEAFELYDSYYKN